MLRTSPKARCQQLTGPTRLNGNTMNKLEIMLYIISAGTSGKYTIDEMQEMYDWVIEEIEADMEEESAFVVVVDEPVH